MNGEPDVSKEIARAASAAPARRKGGSSGDSSDGKKKPRKPRTPVPNIDVDALKSQARTPSRRRFAAVALKTASYSFLDIAEILEYKNIAEAKRDVYKALGDTVDPEDLKAMRQVLILQAEKQLQRSLKYASAETLEDEDGEVYQNYDQLAWHHAAREDMRILGQLSGSFAPIEVHHKTVTDEELNELVVEALKEVGPEGAADVIDAEVIPDGEA